VLAPFCPHENLPAPFNGWRVGFFFLQAFPLCSLAGVVFFLLCLFSPFSAPLNLLPFPTTFRLNLRVLILHALFSPTRILASFEDYWPFRQPFLKDRAIRHPICWACAQRCSRSSSHFLGRRPLSFIHRISSVAILVHSHSVGSLPGIPFVFRNFTGFFFLNISLFLCGFFLFGSNNSLLSLQCTPFFPFFVVVLRRFGEGDPGLAEVP